LGNRLKLCVQYKFWPVGQGLFASGSLRVGPGQPAFNWVYDCGTSSTKGLVTKALEGLSIETKKRAPLNSVDSKPKIDLVAISHFDLDHISGLVSLLKNFAVETLLLPYVPLQQRLLIAFSERIALSSSFFEFFLDPVRFIAKINADSGQPRMVFVLSSGQGGSASVITPAPPDNPNNIGPDEFRLTFEIEPDEGLDEDQKSLVAIRGPDLKGSPRAVFLKRQTGLSIKGLWEFVPYNDADVTNQSTTKGFASFASKVNCLRAQLLKSPDKAVLKVLSDLYDQKFGKSSKSRNLISLFMFAGPIFKIDDSSPMFFCWPRLCPRDGGTLNPIEKFDRFSVLYTGDGYLSSARQFSNLKIYLGKSRLKNVCCFQVMHHGAEGNWSPGLAGKIRPIFSVFSSNPSHRRLKHPHKPVLQDFKKYGPIQVDETNPFELWMCLRA
jgi:hypothetical protein